MGRALIVGCGDVGTRLGHCLIAGGWQVWGLRRTPGKLPPDLGEVLADVRSPLAPERLPEALDTVYYLPTPDRRDPDAYAAVFVRGLQHVLAALEPGARPRLVFVSSTAVYGQDAGEWVDEGSPTRPLAFNGRTLLEAERVATGSRLDTVVARLGGIYGPGRLRLLESVRRAHPCQADPPRFTNRIHRDDASAALAHLAQTGIAARTYLLVDDAPAPECEVRDFIAARLGLPVPPRAGPGDRGQGKRCRNRKLRATGYRLSFPTYREGYGSLIDQRQVQL